MATRVIGISSGEGERLQLIEAQRNFDSSLEWHLFRNAEDYFEYVSQTNNTSESVIIVGQEVEGISQLNLVDAIRQSVPRAMIVPVLASRDNDTVERAMMAGATAALSNTWQQSDLMALMKRLIKTQSHQGDVREESLMLSSASTNVVSFVSAQGGVGKSTLCALYAQRFAESGKRVALIDLDVQFGDIQFLFNFTPEHTLYEALEGLDIPHFEVARLGHELSENLTVYAPGAQPEKAELLFGKVGSLIKAIALNYDVVFVNTGSFWTLFQFEIIEASSEIVCVTEQSIIATRGTQALLKLCEKLNVPTSQFLFAVNKVQPFGLTAHEIARALGLKDIVSFPYFDAEFQHRIDAGNSQRAFADAFKNEPALDSFAYVLAQKLSLSLNDVGAMRTSLKKSSWWWSR